MIKLITVEKVENKIFQIRGKNVMLDRDLAGLYEVPTKALVQAVKRNKERFPDDFMFQLTEQEIENLRSQIVTSSWGGRRKIEAMERKYNGQFKIVFDAIKKLLQPVTVDKKKHIGFHSN